MILFSDKGSISDDMRAPENFKVAKFEKPTQTIRLWIVFTHGVLDMHAFWVFEGYISSRSFWNSIIMRRIHRRLSISAISLGCAFSAQAQAGADVTSGTLPSLPEVTTSNSGSSIPTKATEVSPLHSVPPSSLLDLRMHPAILPREAEVSCSLTFGCFLGLTRGFAVGSDLLRTVGVTALGQHFFSAGAWTYFDAGLGYQFLQQVERRATFMGSFGLRNYGYKNSQGARLARSGVTFRTAYAEAVLPAYTQGLVFDVFSSSIAAEGGANQPFLKTDDKKARNLIEDFAIFMRSYPLLRLQLPADLELVNWKPSELDLPASLRGYLRVSPTFEQTELVLRENQKTIFDWSERRFSLQLMLMGTYASVEQKSGRWAVLGGLGFEVGATSSSLTAQASESELKPNISIAPLVQGRFEIQATYQF